MLCLFFHSHIFHFNFLKLYPVPLARTRKHSITGDIFGLLSAASYGLFTGMTILSRNPVLLEFYNISHQVRSITDMQSN